MKTFLLDKISGANIIKIAFLLAFLGRHVRTSPNIYMYIIYDGICHYIYYIFIVIINTIKIHTIFKY